MSTLLKAYLMETDNPFLMFKCFYEDINKDLQQAENYTVILKKEPSRPTNPVHTFFQDALKDKGNDELREAYNTMKELRREVKSKIGKDIFSIKFKMPRGATKDDPFPKSPYSKYQRETNLFALKRHLKEIKSEANKIKTHRMNDAMKREYRRKLKEVKDKIDVEEKKNANDKAVGKLREQLEYIREVINKNKNINPASVKRLTEAIDVWLKNIPKMMPELKPKITNKEIEEIQGRGEDAPRIRGAEARAFQEALGIKKPKAMISDVGLWLKKIRTYEKNISIFLGGDERTKKRLMERFFKVGKIDELEDIAGGEYKIVGTELIQGKNDKYPKYKEVDSTKNISDFLKDFNSLRTNLKQKRPEGTIVEQLDAAYKELHKVSRLSKDKRKRKEDFFRNIERKIPKKTKRTIVHSMGPKKEYIASHMKRMEEDLDSWLDKEGLEGEDRKNRRRELLETNKHEMEKFKKRVEEIYDKESKRINRKGSVEEMADKAERNRRKEIRERQERQASEDFMRRLSAGETWTSEGFGEED